MCGRYSFVVEDALIKQRFGVSVRSAIYKARYNCVPTQDLAVIATDNPAELQFFRWGLIPSWAKDPAIGNRMINARAETLHEKPSFRNILRNRRCLVPATGFFEWKKDTEKTPYHIFVRDEAAFCFAGLWDKWLSPDGEIVRSFTIITTEPNELMAPIHNRMPVILSRQNERIWLETDDEQALRGLLLPFPSEKMDAWPVSKLVNNPRNDVPEILVKAGNLL
jgi:putative SOS response-associated peptidase YedK